MIGTPGRVLALIECGALETSNIRMFIIDEADRLLDDFFEKDVSIMTFSFSFSITIIFVYLQTNEMLQMIRWTPY